MFFADGTVCEIVFLGRGIEEQTEKHDQFGADRLFGVLDVRTPSILLSREDILVWRQFAVWRRSIHAYYYMGSSEGF